MPEHTTTLCSSFCSYDTSEEEVLRLIGNLSDGKAINENDIPTKIIKLARFVLAQILTRIFNKCINEGLYPDCLKVADLQIWRTKDFLKLSTNIYFAAVQ